MNNQQLNLFSMNPVKLEMGRSKFERPSRHLTSFDGGKLIPLYCEEVLPGDTVSMDFNMLCRMATPICPVMDNAYLDVHFYFVPNRLVWSHWKEYNGENTTGPWKQSIVYSIPQTTAPTSGGDNSSTTSPAVPGWAKGSVASYLGIPIKVGDISVSSLPFRAYCLIWNNYYRDQNVFSPCNVTLGDGTTSGLNSGLYPSTYDTWANSSYVYNGEKGAAPLPVCKFHDCFTSCLPEPQKGYSVPIAIGSYAPIVDAVDEIAAGNADISVFKPFNPSNLISSGTAFLDAPTGTQIIDSDSKDNYSSGTPTGAGKIYKAMLADLGAASSATVNSLREAFALQRYFEKLARGGSRYFESIKTFFGVTVPDSTVQIPEFLGGKRIPINMTSVAQTSSTDSTSPQGNLAAFSQTSASEHGIFTKSFTEHGYLFGVVCVRTEHSYQQGIPKHFLRKDLVDFYNPVFANLGEQAVLNKEIYVQGTSVVDNDGNVYDDQVFGYQEAWYEYRYSPNRISGELASTYASSLDSWHYGDYYQSLPTLGVDFIREPQSNIARTLAVQNHDQFIGDFLFNATWVRPMPLYSIPGLIDHH